MNDRPSNVRVDELAPMNSIPAVLAEGATPPFIKRNPQVKATPEGNIEYEVFKVVDEYHDALTRPNYNWDFENPSADLQYLSTSLIATMIKNHGIGLSACQCDLPYRIFTMGSVNGNQSYIETIVNPTVLDAYGEDIGNEGCLSFPGVFLEVKRATRVTAEYQNIAGLKVVKTFDGLTARVFLHEYDHCNGIKFNSHVKAFAYQKAKEKAKSVIRKQNKAIKQSEINMRRAQALANQMKSAPLTYSTDSRPDLVIKTDSGPTITITD